MWPAALEPKGARWRDTPHSSTLLRSTAHSTDHSKYRPGSAGATTSPEDFRFSVKLPKQITHTFLIRYLDAEGRFDLFNQVDGSPFGVEVEGVRHGQRMRLRGSGRNVCNGWKADVR